MLTRMNGRSKPSHPTRTAVDTKLMERSGLDEFSLRLVRREFMDRLTRMPYTAKKALAEGGTCPRFGIMNEILQQAWSDECWLKWLRYLEHSQQDVDEMCRGEYPISPYIIRVYSALFGIKVEFLVLGTTPSVDRVGANIDVWPLTGY